MDRPGSVKASPSPRASAAASAAAPRTLPWGGRSPKSCRPGPSSLKTARLGSALDAGPRTTRARRTGLGPSTARSAVWAAGLKRSPPARDWMSVRMPLPLWPGLHVSWYRPGFRLAVSVRVVPGPTFSTSPLILSPSPNTYSSVVLASLVRDLEGELARVEAGLRRDTRLVGGRDRDLLLVRATTPLRRTDGAPPPGPSGPPNAGSAVTGAEPPFAWVGPQVARAEPGGRRGAGWARHRRRTPSAGATW